jgi:hypothetical protein
MVVYAVYSTIYYISILKPALLGNFFKFPNVEKNNFLIRIKNVKG